MHGRLDVLGPHDGTAQKIGLDLQQHVAVAGPAVDAQLARRQLGVLAHALEQVRGLQRDRLERGAADLGAARRYTQIEALTWDEAANDFIRLDHFFDLGRRRDEALIAISHHVREAIKNAVWRGSVSAAYQPLVLQATNPDPAVLANFTIEGDALAFHYSPREIAPLDVGAPVVRTPLSVFAAWLNANGRAAFR